MGLYDFKLAERYANPGFLVFAIIEIELEAIHAQLAQMPTRPELVRAAVRRHA